jgi:hypothetical protein
VTVADLAWVEIEQRFGAARNWWVATSSAAGPHAVPIWGVAVDGVLTFYGEDTAARSRNLLADPRAVLHLEDGDDPLILHARVTRAGVVDGREDLFAAYRAKYDDPTDAEFLPHQPSYAGTAVWVVEPVKAIAWAYVASEEWTTRRWTPTT